MMRHSPRLLLTGAFTLMLSGAAACGQAFRAAPSCEDDPSACAGAAATDGGAPTDVEVRSASGGSLPGAGEATGGSAVIATGGSSAGEPVGSAGADTASSAGAGGDAEQTLPVSCQAALARDSRLASGDVTIDPDGSGPARAFNAHCDMKSDGGGWTQIGVGEYWQKNDLDLASDAVLPWPELTALLATSQHLFRAGDGDQRLYMQDEGALVEKVGDPLGTSSTQPWLWRSTASSMKCATSYESLLTNSMSVVTTKEVSCEPLAFGKHTCGISAGWILFRKNDTANFSGENPCAFPMAIGATPDAPTGGSLRPLWLR